MQVFQNAVAETPPEVIREALEDLTQCTAEFENLNRALDEKCGPATGTAMRLRRRRRTFAARWETCAEVIKSIVQASPEESDGETPGNDGGAMAAVGDSRLRSLAIAGKPGKTRFGPSCRWRSSSNAPSPIRRFPTP